MAKNKKKKKSSKTTKGYLKYLIILICIVLLSGLLYVFLNLKDDNTDLTVVEKKWIAENTDTLMDINVPNNLSVISDNGNGVVFDYIHKIETDTELRFNKKSYNYEDSINSLNGLSVLVLGINDKINNKDMQISEDNYVLASLNDKKVEDITDVSNAKIGVLSSDSKYLKNIIGLNYQYKEYKTLDMLVKGITKKEIDYIIVPRYYGLESIVVNKLNINYTFDNISNKIVLRTSGKNKLNSIMKKYLTKFKNENYFSSYEKSFMNFYRQTSGVTDMNITSLSNKVYSYGYVKDSNYNLKQGKKLSGFAGEYISMLSSMANMDMKYKEYSNSEDLASAIESDEIDIAFIDFDYDNTNGLYTKNGFNTSLVALSKTNYQFSTKEGLVGRKVYSLKGSPITTYLKNNINTRINEIKSINSYVPDDGVLVLDEIDYYYYTSDGKLNNYYTLVKDSYNSNYSYFVQKDESILYNYINFILSYADSNSIKENSVKKLVDDSINKSNFASVYIIIIIAILVPILLIFALVVFFKNKNHTKLLRKESVLRYTDMLTSLKNRNYLRANMDTWDEAKISPRAVIVIDLNNLSYVNDNYGQEEGNTLIKKAAAILINTQLEKSEIMRTDGNEFLLYLVGYTKTQVNTYVNKLSREFEKLPYNFGAAIGYSMIEDEIKTIDDAINEANIAMREDKEQNYK